MALATACFAGFIVMILAQVGYRYLDFSMIYSEDAARLLNVYAVFFGLVMVVHRDGDVRIDLIDRWLTKGASGSSALAVLRIGYSFIMLTFLSAVALGSFLLMRSNWGLSLPAIPFLHQGHIYLAPFAGSLLSIVIVVGKFQSHFKSIIKYGHTDWPKETPE